MTSEEGMKMAMKGFILLLIITLLEVGIALVGNGHLISGVTLPKFIMIPVMIILSIYKAYYIVSEFMHLGHETKGMAASVVLPTLLLVWAIIAFLWEGDYWKSARDQNKPEPKTISEVITAPEIQKVDNISSQIYFG